jgi:hypothetical protein
MGAIGIGFPQQEGAEHGTAQRHVLPRRAFLLAAITACLFGQTLGALDALLGPIAANGKKQVPVSPRAEMSCPFAATGLCFLFSRRKYASVEIRYPHMGLP